MELVLYEITVSQSYKSLILAFFVEVETSRNKNADNIFFNSLKQSVIITYSCISYVCEHLKYLVSPLLVFTSVILCLNLAFVFCCTFEHFYFFLVVKNNLLLKLLIFFKIILQQLIKFTFVCGFVSLNQQEKRSNIQIDSHNFYITTQKGVATNGLFSAIKQCYSSR